MSISPRDSIRHLRLARALAGNDLDGMALIEEIGSISKLASHYVEDDYGENGSGPKLTVLEDAFRTIARHAKLAIKRCAAVTEAAQAFIDQVELPEFDRDVESEDDAEADDDDEFEEEDDEVDGSDVVTPKGRPPRKL